MNNIFTLAKKEFRDIFRSRIFIYILAMLLVLVVISLVVAEVAFRDQVAQYNSSLLVLQNLGKTPTGPNAQLYPLNLLRGVVDYIEIIGAILGIFLGYLSIYKEKNSQAIKLLLTRPVRKTSIIYGKLLGNFVFIGLVLVVVAGLVAVSLGWVGGVSLGTVDYWKLLIFVLISTLYVMIFFVLSMCLALWQKNIVNALVVAFAIWLVFVLILPQIGDTMDPDNQVPGGFFQTMALSREQEKTVLANFNNYEYIRGGVEQLSITKHYERSIFALFGVKSDYNGWALMDILKDQWGNNLAVVVLLSVGIGVTIWIFRQNRRLLSG